MTALSILAATMAGAVFYLGGYHLLVFWRRPARRADLAFALSCLTVAAYDLASSGLYLAPSPAEGVMWQRLQLGSVCLLTASFTWFIVFHTDHRSYRIAQAISAIFLVMAVLELADPWGVAWTDTPSVKHVALPFGIELAYQEMASGPLSMVHTFLASCVFVYALWLSVRYLLRGKRAMGGALTVCLGLFFAGALSDSAVASGLYHAPYLSEFAFMGIVVLMAFSMSREVAESDAAGSRILEREQRYRQLFDSANDTIFIMDGSVFVDCNKKTLTMFHCRRDEIIGQSPDAFSPPVQPDGEDTGEKGRRHIEAALCGEPQFFEWQHRLPDGTEFDAEVSLNAIELDGRPHLQAIVRDVTDRKRVEEERARLVAAIEHAAEDIIITDPDGCIEYVNPAFERITGYSREEAIGKTPRILKSGVHDAAYYEQLWRAIKGGRIWEGRITNRRKDGSLVEEDCTISPIVDGAGRTLGFVSVKRDITEQTKIENQMRQVQKMEAIGTLAGGIAHDFNNILSAIIGYTELAMADIPADSVAQAGLGEVLRAGCRASDLVGQILTFSRRTEQERKPLRLASVVGEALKLLRGSLPATIDIDQAVTEGCPPILADATQMHQVLMNLCTNAFHAMEHGGTLRVGLCPVELTKDDVKWNLELRPGHYACLAVADTGHGMSEEVRRRIFEPYYTTKEEGKGTGMGLATVHGIVKSHGGAVFVYSEPGQGTEFKIYLPCIEDAASEKRSDVAPVPPAAGERLLIVDDEQAILNINRTLLERAGYRVEAYLDPREALAAFRHAPDDYDALVTDRTMPNMTGFDLIREIRITRPGLPVVMTTGLNDAAFSEEATQCGVRFVVSKPVSLSGLTHALHEALEEAGSPQDDPARRQPK
ncbi:MAG: PAS domain S-box protein [bacterium]|nr:PAS domain S-box protein [bacterium]